MEHTLHHSVEAAVSVIRRELDARGGETRTELRRRCERCFRHVENKRGEASADGLEIWCAAVGVSVASEVAARSRVAPLLDGAATLRYARGRTEATSTKRLRFDELAGLVLADEARDASRLLDKTREYFGRVVSDAEDRDKGDVLIRWLARRAKTDASSTRGVSRRDACAALLDLDLGGGDRISPCGAVILSERLDADHDGVVDAADAVAWLVPPRPVSHLKAQLARWRAAREPTTRFSPIAQGTAPAPRYAVRFRPGGASPSTTRGLA